MDIIDKRVLQSAFNQYGLQILYKFKEVYDKVGVSCIKRDKKEFIALIEKELEKVKSEEDCIKEIISLATLLYLMYANQITKG